MSGELLITVTRSAGDDRAVTVFIDTQFNPTGDPGLRILVNDDEAYVGKAYDIPERSDKTHEAHSVQFSVGLEDIAYTGREV